MVFGVCLCIGNKFITWKCHLPWETMRSAPSLQKQFSIPAPIVQKFDDNIHWVNHYTMISQEVLVNLKLVSIYQLDKQLLTSNNQRLEKCVQFVLLPYNWDLHIFFLFFGWPTTTDVVWNSQWSSLNSSCLASDWFQHDNEAKRVGQSKMAPAINTRGTEKRRK